MGKYFKYAIGEILLVVLGILIALQINNWNEERKQRQKEVIYLTELKKGLESDLRGEFEPAKSAYSGILQYHVSIELYFSDQKTFTIDSLSKYFRFSLSPEWDFVFNMSPYENINSAGIDIITNDSLRSKIASLYSYSYPNIREVNQNYIRYYDQQITPLVYAKVILSKTSYTAEELDFLSNSIEVRNRLNHLRRRRYFLLKQLLIPVQQTIEALIVEIDSELEQL